MPRRLVTPKTERQERIDTARRVCAGKRCEAPVDGARFCPACAERLAAIRVEFEAESNFKKNRRMFAPVCSVAGCYEPRPKHARVCYQHADLAESLD